MDKATILKVINGISEKLEKFIDSIDKKFDLAGDLFKKLQNQIKDLKSEDLEIFDKIKDLSIRIDEKIYSKIAVDDKIAKQKETNQIFDDSLTDLQKQINKLDNICVEQYDVLEAKIKELDERIIKVNDRTSKLIKQSGDYIIKLNDKIKELEKKININKDNCVSNNDYKKLWEENTDDYNFLACKRLEDYTKGIKNSENIDNLESKYYKLRSELDSIYKVLEMDALDIQDLYNKIDKHPKNKGDNNE